MAKQAGVPLVILAGKEYGSGSSRDWAAKGTKLTRWMADAPSFVVIVNPANKRLEQDFEVCVRHKVPLIIGLFQPTEYAKLDETVSPVALQTMADWIEARTLKKK